MRFYYLGIWGSFAWMYWMRANNTSLPDDFSWRNIYFGISLTLILVAFISARRQRLFRTDDVKRYRVLDIASALVMSCTCFAVSYPQFFGDPATVASLSVLMGGIAIGWVYVRWAFFITQLEVIPMAICLLGGSIIRTITQIVLDILPGITSLLFAMSLSIISVFMLTLSLSNIPKSTAPIIRYPAHQFFLFWRVWLLLGIVSLCLATLNTNYSLYGFTSGMYFAKSLCMLAVYGGLLFWIAKTSFAFSFISLWRILLLVLACSMVLMQVVPDSEFLRALLLSANEIIMPLLWLTVCDIARHSTLNPYTAVCVGLLTYNIPSFLGAMLHEMLSMYLPLDIWGSIFILALFLTLTICLNPSDFGLRYVFEDIRGKAPLPTEFQTIDERCEALGGQKGLTKREIEVMQMVCKGRSRTYIAETLFITPSTAKSHISHIYAKLGIHSKKELQDLIGV